MNALRIRDGAVLWSAPAQAIACGWKSLWCNPALSQAVSAIPGVAFAGSMDGHFRAYDSATGKILLDNDTAVPHRTVDGQDVVGGGLDGAGATIAGGMVYVTSGYQGRSTVNNGGVLLAYSVDGK
jgi:polyvinyl alcohol dehydrogenase (cytochrome)